MMMCSRCNKNVAVMFVTKIENGEKKTEGLCLSCAKQLGLDMGQLAGNMGLDPENFENISEQVLEMMESEGDEEGGNLFRDLFGFLEGEKESEPEEEIPEKEEKKGDKKKKKKL